MIRFLCSCGKRLKAPAGKGGWKSRCPACQHSLIIPDELPSSVAKATVPLGRFKTSAAEPITFNLGPQSSDRDIDAYLARYNLLPGAAGMVKRAIRAGTFRGFQVGASAHRAPQSKRSTG